MEPRAGWREWAGLAVLALPTLLVSLDLFVMLTALPRLTASLHASSVQQLWIVDIYGFMVAGFLITMGTVGDRIGRRKLLLGGAAAFGVASLLTAYSASPALLIAARALLGLAGATLTPSTLALSRTYSATSGSGPPRWASGRAVSPWGDHRPARRRRDACPLLVGLGVLAQRAGHGTAAGRRPVPAPRVP
jgi:MFS family permease